MNWKLVDVAKGVNVPTDEERIYNSLVEKLKFGRNQGWIFWHFLKLKFGLDMEHKI